MRFIVVFGMTCFFQIASHAQDSNVQKLIQSVWSGKIIKSSIESLNGSNCSFTINDLISNHESIRSIDARYDGSDYFSKNVDLHLLNNDYDSNNFIAFGGPVSLGGGLIPYGKWKSKVNVTQGRGDEIMIFSQTWSTDPFGVFWRKNVSDECLINSKVIHEFCYVQGKQVDCL